MGKRYANIRDRAFVAIKQGGTFEVGYCDQFLEIHTFVERYKATPCLVVGDFAFKHQGLHVNHPLAVLWCVPALGWGQLL
jgi:hypothetical protein